MDAAMLVVCGLMLLTAGSMEPSVNRQEQASIQGAMAESATNAPAAIAVLREQVTDDSSPAVDFVLGNLLYQQEAWGEAEQAYRNALAKHPSFRRAAVNLAHVLMRQGKTGDAVDTLSGWLAQGQPDADLLLLLGQALVEKRQYVSGESAFRQALLLDTASNDARLGLAKCLLEQHHHLEAAGLLDELLANNSESGELWSLKANLFIALGETDNAVISIESARRLGVASPSLLATLGDLYINRGQATDALRMYELAFDRAHPTSDQVLRAAEGFLMLKDSVHAREMLDRLPPAPTPNRRSRILAASAARMEGKIAEAKAAFADVLAEDPLDGKALLALGELEAESGAEEEAALTFERASRVAGFEAEALVAYAQLEVERGDFAKAVQLLERSLTFENSPRVSRYVEQVRRLAELN